MDLQASLSPLDASRPIDTTTQTLTLNSSVLMIKQRKMNTDIILSMINKFESFSFSEVINSL